LAVLFHGGIQPLASIARDYEDNLGRAALEQLHALANSVNAMSVSSAAEIRTMTGGTYLLLHGTHDRRSGRAELVDNLIRFVVASFPGSYGLVYERDRHASLGVGGRSGVWSVKAIKRGRVEPALDPFPSPTVPVVEDAENTAT